MYDGNVRSVDKLTQKVDDGDSIIVQHYCAFRAVEVLSQPFGEQRLCAPEILGSSRVGRWQRACMKCRKSLESRFRLSAPTRRIGLLICTVYN
jgi:hypothetical protein